MSQQSSVNMYIIEGNVICGNNIPDKDWSNGSSDPYCAIHTGENKDAFFTSKSKMNKKNPEWNQHFQLISTERPSSITFTVFDSDKDELINTFWKLKSDDKIGYYKMEFKDDNGMLNVIYFYINKII